MLVKTLTQISRPAPTTTGVGAAQTSCVGVVHAVVAQSWPEMYAEGLRSLHWKFAPSTVMVEAPETWVFMGAKEETLELHVGYAARSVVPHAKKIAPLLQLDSALAELKADTRLDTRSTFHAPMFWSNAVAPLNACEPNEMLSKSTQRISPEPLRVS